MTKLDLPENFDSLSYDDQISTILRISTRQATVFIHSHLSYLEEYLNNKYPKLKNPLYSLKTKLNWFYHNRTDFPICKVCGNPFGINKNTKSIINDYSKWCSSKHALQDEEVKQKREQTNTQKYGTGNVFASEYGKKKLRETQEKLYGGLGSGSPIIKQRIAQTCKIKYNADSPLESKEIQNKIKQGFIEKHGVDNPFKLQEIQDKIKQANLEKHGVENISYSNYFKQKIIDNLWEKMINHPDAIPMFTKDQYVDDLTYYDWKCKKCGKVFKSRWDAGHLISKCDCQKLFKGYSNQERQVSNYVQSIYCDEIILNSRKVIPPYEIDIYFPKLNKGIEYNGNYWHTKNGSKERDQQKLSMCQSIGLDLMVIWEKDWLSNQNQIKENIQNFLFTNIS